MPNFEEYSSPLFKALNLLKLTDIVKQSNISFAHNFINNQTPHIFKGYFTLSKVAHKHHTVNSLNLVYSLPAGSLELPMYITSSGKSSTKYICASAWNSTLKDLSIKNIEKYNSDPFWLSNTNNNNVNHTLKKHFLEH